MAGGQEASQKQPCSGRPAERGREGDEDDQMAAAAETGGEFGGHVLFNAPPVGKETPTGEEAFLEIVEEFVLANRCCRP